jgi:hypothetical protein
MHGVLRAGGRGSISTRQVSKSSTTQGRDVAGSMRIAVSRIPVLHAVRRDARVEASVAGALRSSAPSPLPSAPRDPGREARHCGRAIVEHRGGSPQAAQRVSGQLRGGVKTESCQLRGRCRFHLGALH